MSDPRLALFDIDGTLLFTGGAGGRAMARAAREVFGERFRWDGVEPAGGLDPLLLDEAARRSGLSLGAVEHRAFRDRYIECLRSELDARREDVRALRGVARVLNCLRARDAEVVLGLLSGNYGPSARLKLEAAGIAPDTFRLGVFGDEAPDRPALVRRAVERCRESLGVAVPSERVVVVGDTPRDVACARENGCVAFAVATGPYGVAELRAAGAHEAVDDLGDPRPLLRWLGLPPALSPPGS